ncbi:aminoglycoside phosphotransferase [Oceanicola sp. D3]|uniref:aminoglycoside phosphotransferase family protein n=1 Tax=Oceanicola sp. D3 TaxID=2587163 RepID=UPI00111DF818|nr:phosphotransferase [Oceanicola sp. D3]QDC08020.1 aminoglycoside phosphotransferase [Oceanicola sp. D3]
MNTVETFLASAGWADAHREALAGDASSRRYERLTRGPDRAVLMNDPGGDLQPFLRIGRHLSATGLSAPEIYATEPDNGLILMEDFGNSLLARLAEEEPGNEANLYRAATDVLITLRTAPLPDGLQPYGPAEMALAVSPAAEFYAPATEAPVIHHSWLELTSALEEALLASDMSPPVLIHRDYHAENLIWLPERSGAARVGLLDFQDALAGHAAYDFASLIGDVRREISAPVREAAIRHYLDATGEEEARFTAALAAQGAQRNLRILGMFARLCTHMGKPGYLSMMPRVWSLLMADLSHPSIETLREAVLSTLPEPTPERIERIRRSAK